MARVRLDKLIDYWDLELRAAFLEAIQNIRDKAQIEQMVRALDRGDVDAALRAVNLDPANFRPWDKTLFDAFEAGGNATASGFPLLGAPGELRLVFQFNVRNPVAEAWISQFSSQSVVEILDDQRNMIREFLRAGLEKGNNPRTVALDLVGRIGSSGVREGGTIGLTSSQADWVRNYAEELASDNPKVALTRLLRDKRFDKTVINAADSDTPLTVDQIQKMVGAYTNRALRYRAENIARTEAMSSLHEAQAQAIRQAVESGAIAASAVSFIWNTAEDSRVRDSHDTMDKQKQPMGRKFVTGNGVLLEYPGDPSGPPEEIINCRCWREPDVDFLAGVH